MKIKKSGFRYRTWNIERYFTALLNVRIFGKKYGGLHLIIDNEYPITCFSFHPFYKVYGIDFAIKDLFHFSLTYDFMDYSDE